MNAGGGSDDCPSTELGLGPGLLAPAPPAPAPPVAAAVAAAAAAAADVTGVSGEPCFSSRPRAPARARSSAACGHQRNERNSARP